MSRLITGGLYTVGEASRLLQTSERRIRGWITGYSGTRSAPVLRNDVGWLNNQLAFSFANLMEMRFIEYFAHKGVRVSSIRTMAQEAQRLLEHPHPFATQTIFKTDGRKIFAEIAEQTGDPKLYDLKAKNWAMLPIMEQSLLKDTVYNARGDAVLWRPRVNAAPNVIIHPSISFGQPVLENHNIPTRTLSDAFDAEGSIDAVVEWFRVAPDEVHQAIEFEQRLAMAA